MLNRTQGVEDSGTSVAGLVEARTDRRTDTPRCAPNTQPGQAPPAWGARTSLTRLGLLVSSQALNQAPSLQALEGSSGVGSCSPKGKKKTRKMSKKECYFTKLFLPFCFPSPETTPFISDYAQIPPGPRLAPRPCPQHPGHGAVLEAAARRSCPLPPQGPAMP